MSALDGLLLEPEGDGEEKQRGEEPGPAAEGHRPQGRERRPIRRHDDAPVTVHRDDRQSPEKHRATDELSTNQTEKQVIRNRKYPSQTLNLLFQSQLDHPLC